MVNKLSNAQEVTYSRNSPSIWPVKPEKRRPWTCCMLMWRTHTLPHPLTRWEDQNHNLVPLTPCYVPLVKSLSVTTKTVRTWSENCYEALQGCFEVTDWNVLCKPHGEDTDGLTECITDYIHFCVDGIVPARTVFCYPNNRPWVT